MDKVTIVANDEFEKLFPEFQPSRVTLTLTDGVEYRQRVDVPKGDPRDPMTEDEIAMKFNALGRDVVGERRCTELRELIMAFEHEQSLERFFRLMTT